MAQGGDFCKHNGTGGESIYGRHFKDENFTIKHSEKYLLSMANSGPNTNGSQFFLTFEPCPWLNGKHVVFGKVEIGQEVIEMMRKTPSDNNDKPRLPIKITKCGQMKLKTAPVAAPKEEEKKEVVAEADDAEEDTAGALRGVKKEVAAPGRSIMDKSKGIKKDGKKKKPAVKSVVDEWDEEDRLREEDGKIRREKAKWAYRKLRVKGRDD